MLALAYDAALRREELCSLRTDDVDPAHRTPRVRAETTKNRLERVVPYSAPTGVLLSQYLAHRASVSRARGPLFLSESRRNRAQPLSLWTWSKVVRRIALASGVERFSTHTTRHLCLTDLARMGWEVHAIAAFAGHRHTDSTLRYIHLSGRDLADKAQPGHAAYSRPARPGPDQRRGHGGGPVTSISTAGRADSSGPWQWPVDAARYDTAPLLRAAEQDAVAELGPGNLRRLARHDPAAPGWKQIRRLLRPLDDATAALEGPLTSHRRRAMLDATAVALLRCAETGRSYWSWTDEEWAGLLGQDQDGFRKAAPGWADDAVRPYLAAHAFLLGGFTAFCRLGSFSRLTLAWRVFGRDRVDSETGRIRSVLAGWGYRLGRDDDQLLPMVACQVLLLNRSPHLEDLSTGLFERVRRERLLPAARGNTLHAMQRAVAELGFCDPQQRLTGRHSVRAGGGPPAWEAQVERWHGTSALSPRVRDSVRATLLKAGRWLEAEQPDAADPASWTRQTCAAWVAAVDRMKVGDYVQRTAGLKDRLGKPLEAATKAGHLAALRTFFRDLQEWEQIPRRFDPQRALAVPRSIAALLGPDPRVIADDIWAKLTSATATAPTPSSSSARTAWPAQNATSTRRRTPVGHRSWRPGRTCRRCGR
jgi:site-specific recombinase XerD